MTGKRLPSDASILTLLESIDLPSSASTCSSSLRVGCNNSVSDARSTFFQSA